MMVARGNSLWLLLLLAGCASIDFDHPRESSTAIGDTDETYLGKQVVPYVQDKPESESGFHVLIDGVDAFAARLTIADVAERSIDAQYYLIKNDLTGKVFVHTLLAAADRGVRVRLLLDDILTQGFDTALVALDSHPNFEIRVFNPFNRGAIGRGVSVVTDFGRINRRLHNKSFTVDNQITIFGGRNIADEYFGAREDQAFDDLDVAAIGNVVLDVSTMFDAYWNHETALPVRAFIRAPEDAGRELDRIRIDLRSAVAGIEESKYAGAYKSRAYDYVHTDSSVFRWAPYQLVYDSPDIGVRERASDAESILTPLIAPVEAAQRSIVVVSPYFVPRKSGVQRISAMRERGIEVTVVTNSLVANNQLIVHAGYLPSRKPLLKNGVRLYEVRPDWEVPGTEFVDASGARATLHSKAYIVDAETVFIGSFNFDPRSAYINTELGVLIRDPELAQRLLAEFDEDVQHSAYEVFLDKDGNVRWRGLVGGEEVIYDTEPESSFWQRSAVGLIRLLPIRGQL